MTAIYSHQAKSFFIESEGFYSRPAARPLVEFMEEISRAIRSLPMELRTSASGLVKVDLHAAWFTILHALRPYQFVDFNERLDAFKGSKLELPACDDSTRFHGVMLQCLDMIEDLDSLAIMIFSDPEATDEDRKVLHSAWSAVYRLTNRSESLVRRIRKLKPGK